MFYCVFMENYVKPLPNWIYFPTITILFISQILHSSLSKRKESSLVSTVLLIFSLLFIYTNSQILKKDYVVSKERLENRANIYSSFNKRKETLKNKIIVNVGAEIPASNWCLPFNDCNLRKEFRFTGLGWTTQMGHDLLFYRKHNISNLAVDLVNNDKFVVAIDLYPLIKNRLIKFYEYHYSCTIRFDNFLSISRSSYSSRQYKMYLVKSNGICHKK